MATIEGNIYRHFIKENVAPKKAKRIVVQKGTNKVGMIPFGIHSQPNIEKNYSFCAISDVHVQYSTAEDDLKRALNYVNDNDVNFTCICGDLTSAGGDTELGKYKTIASVAKKPIYAITGNHETLAGHITFDYPTIFTGYPLYYTIGIDRYGNKVDESVNGISKAFGDNVRDVFLFVGYTGNSTGGWTNDGCITQEELQYIYEILEKNRNKRCFVWHHVYPYQDMVGDACRYYNGNYWNQNDNGKGTAFHSLIKHYKNTMLFHGHSHLRFHLQSEADYANYAYTGYRNVHIPSLAVPRDRVDGGTNYIYAESEGYIIDVYDNYVVLNGMDFIDNLRDGMVIPLGTIKIDFQPVVVPEKSFVDSTGLINI